jgi:hypothetical protein
MMLPPKEVNMTTKNQIGLAVGWIAVVVLAITFIAASSMAYAKSSPLAEGTGNLATADTLERRAITDRNWTLPSNCNDKQAKILFKAGFNRPGMLRGAWAITWRESKHEALDESSLWYSGALGTWQIQTSAWSGRSWWSRDNMLDKEKQSEIVRKHFLNDGMHNWGYGYSFKNDSWYENAGMYYSLWGSGLTYPWVIAPFNTGWSLFPKKCTPEKI